MSVQWTVEKRLNGSVWHGRSDGSRDEAGSGVWGLGIGQREVIIWKGNMGCPIVTNGGLFTIVNSHCGATRLLLAKFLELQAHRAREAYRLRRSNEASCHVTVGRLAVAVAGSCAISVSFIRKLCSSRRQVFIYEDFSDNFLITRFP